MMVSICIATCNGEANLYETLSSIEKQTYKDFECIIVDDHSTDDTVYIAYTFAKRDKRFKVFVNMTDTSMPYADAHNKSYEYATGDLLFRIDQDDVLTERYIETYVQLMTAPENKEYDAISTYPIFFEIVDGERKDIIFIPDERMYSDCEKFNNENLITFNTTPDAWFNQSSCIRKSFYDKYHPKFTHTMRGDLVFWWNVFSYGARLKTFTERLLYKRHTDHTTFYTDLYRKCGDMNQFQIDVARYKQLAFEKLYEKTNDPKYIDCIDIFRNTVEFFENERNKA